MTFSLLLVAKIVVSLILIMPAMAKLTGKKPAKDMFKKLDAEPHGRIVAGVMEIVAIVFLRFGGYVRVGAGLALLTMIGAIGAHLTKLGIDKMFYMALVVLLSSGYIFWIHLKIA